MAVRLPPCNNLKHTSGHFPVGIGKTQLAEQTGFDPVRVFRDSKGWFLDALWKVRKGS